MRILHTSDWHIGKRLHQKDLLPDIRAFFDWLIHTIQSEQVDVLLVSGDIFDLANPSSEARSVYYDFLTKTIPLSCQVILSGGNHDSPAVLNAPKDLLAALDMQIVGGLPDDLNRLLFPLTDKHGEQVVIAAIPYLRDSEIRNLVSGESHQDRIEAIRAGIQKVYSDVAAICQRQYPNLPIIAMGHLLAEGAQLSDSERDIQIGNLSSFQAKQFGDAFSYMALGHIHKPQTVSKRKRIYYSGSPIPLSFSEKDDEKRVLIIDTADDFSVRSLTVPRFRKIKKIKGDYENVKQLLRAYQPESSELTDILDIDIIEPQYDPNISPGMSDLISTFNEQHAGLAEIIHQRLQFEHKPSDTADLYDVDVQLQNLQPQEVFEKRIETDNINNKDKALLIDAFNEIYQEVLQEN